MEPSRDPDVETPGYPHAVAKRRPAEARAALAPIASRASRIESLSITGFDALHIAAAEAAGCDHLLTTDDRLLKKSKRHPGELMVTLLNPLDLISPP